MIERDFEGEFYRYVCAAGYADREWNRQVLEFYLPYFAACKRVLDVGCGEGQMLELLAAAGIAAVGIDSDASMIQTCRERSLAAIEADLFDYLPGPESPFDGIFSSNVIEHLSAEQAARFVQLSFAGLRPGGILLVATPNPESLIVHMYEFWRDATHVRLYNRQLLEFLLYRAGLRKVVSQENPHTAWTPPIILQEQQEGKGQRPKGLVEPISQMGLTELAAPPSVSAPEWPPLSTMPQQLPFPGRLWDPPPPEKPVPWWRAPAVWMRRRLARILVGSAMYEEFMIAQRQSADLRSAVEALREQVGGVAAYAQVCAEKSWEVSNQALRASMNEMERRVLELASGFETSLDRRFEDLSRNLANLSAAQTEPLRRPREIFVVGFKPLADGQVPSVPA